LVAGGWRGYSDGRFPIIRREMLRDPIPFYIPPRKAPTDGTLCIVLPILCMITLGILALLHVMCATSSCYP
jgi:hypothetical protein